MKQTVTAVQKLNDPAGVHDCEDFGGHAHEHEMSCSAQKMNITTNLGSFEMRAYESGILERWFAAFDSGINRGLPQHRPVLAGFESLGGPDECLRGETKGSEN